MLITAFFITLHQINKGQKNIDSSFVFPKDLHNIPGKNVCTQTIEMCSIIKQGVVTQVFGMIGEINQGNALLQADGLQVVLAVLSYLMPRRMVSKEQVWSISERTISLYYIRKWCTEPQFTANNRTDVTVKYLHHVKNSTERG